MIDLLIKLAVSGFVIAGFIFIGPVLVEAVCAAAAKLRGREL